jgi:hypothetical protein
MSLGIAELILVKDPVRRRCGSGQGRHAAGHARNALRRAYAGSGPCTALPCNRWTL